MQDIEIIEEILNKKNLKVSPILGRGQVNRVCKVTSAVSHFIIRLNNESQLGRFNKEAWCAKVSSESGVLGPKVIKTGKLKGSAYMLLEFKNGKNGKEITYNEHKIWETLGSYAKIINNIKTSGFGENMVSPGVFSDSWERYINYNIESLNEDDPILKLGVLNRESSNKLKEKFTGLKYKKFNFGLIHGDLSFANIIVDGDSVNLIDWGNGRSEIVPHMEIADLLQNQISDTSEFFKDFLTGYGMTLTEYQKIKSDIEDLTILQAVDKLRWAIDKSPNDISKFTERIKGLLF